jgi:hypothetical protein
MEQAFSFYAHVRRTCPLRDKPRLLDFGGGWGRIARLWLRETTPDRLWVADCLTDSIALLRSTGFPGRVVQNAPMPPLPPETPTGTFDLVYAFSVFSHLSEPAYLAWTDHLRSLLQPGGHLVYTTRSSHHIEHVANQQRAGKAGDHGWGGMPDAAVIRERYASGTFQFYPIPGGGELTDDFYGEAFVPPEYIRRRHGGELVELTESVPLVDQAVVVVRRAAA